MKITRSLIQFWMFGCAFLLYGCGTTLPIMDLKFQTDAEFAEFMRQIVIHVRCELAEAVNNNYSTDPKSRRHILKTWAAKIALNIKAVDKGNFNPGVADFDKAVTFTFAGTGSVEADGTRELTMTYFILFDELIDAGDHGSDANREVRQCPRSLNQDEPISGDLGIEQTLFASLKTWDDRYALSDEVVDGPFDTITHHAQFVVISGATATPTWKLVHISANTSPPFLGATRTSTDDLLITMGPTTLGTRKEQVPPGPRKGAKVGVKALVPSDALDESFSVERLRGALAPH